MSSQCNVKYPWSSMTCLWLCPSSTCPCQCTKESRHIIVPCYAAYHNHSVTHKHMSIYKMTMPISNMTMSIYNMSMSMHNRKSSYHSPVLYAAYDNHSVTHGGDVRIPSAGLLSSSAVLHQSEPRTGINRPTGDGDCESVPSPCLGQAAVYVIDFVGVGPPQSPTHSSFPPAAAVRR